MLIWPIGLDVALNFACVSIRPIELDLAINFALVGGHFYYCSVFLGRGVRGSINYWGPHRVGNPLFRKGFGAEGWSLCQRPFLVLVLEASYASLASSLLSSLPIAKRPRWKMLW